MTLNPLNLIPFFATANLRKAVESYNAQPSAELAVKAARLLSAAGRREEALRFIKEAKRVFPNSSKVSDAYIAIRRHQARLSLKRAKRKLKQTQQLESFIRVSDLYRTLGDYGRAQRYLEKADKLFADHWAVHLILGKLHFSRFRERRRESDAEACLNHLGHAKELNPDSYQVLIHFALVTTHLGHFHEAYETLEIALQRFPEDRKALRLKGHVERALEVAPDSPVDPVEQQDPAAVGPTIPGTANTPGLLGDLSGIQGVAGVFAIDEDGSVEHTALQPSTAFVLDDAEDTVKAIVAECRYNAISIGIGELQSCHCTGDSWQVYLRTHDSQHVVLFAESNADESNLTKATEEILSAELQPA